MEEQENSLLSGQADIQEPVVEQETSINAFSDEPEEPQVTKMERPEGLDAQFWDEEAGNFKGNDLFEEMKKQKDIALGLRQKLSKGVPASEAPESADGYQLDAEKIAEELGHEIPENDVGLNIFKKVAFENGLSPEKFQSIFTGYMKEALANEEMNPTQESQIDHEEYQRQEIEKLGKEGPQTIRAIANWKQQMVYDGILDENDSEALESMGTNAAQIRVLMKLRSMNGHIAMPDMGQSIDGMPSQQEIDKIMASPEYETDPVLQKKVNDYFEKKYS